MYYIHFYTGTSRSDAARQNGSTCVYLVEDCKEATSLYFFYLTRKSSKNKEDKMAIITCTRVQ